MSYTYSTEQPSDMDSDEDQHSNFLSKYPPAKFPDTYKQVRVRLETFNSNGFKWPVSWITPKKLASNGFVCLQRGDQVQCYYCRVGLDNFYLGDDVEKRHRSFYTGCPRLRMIEYRGFTKAQGVMKQKKDLEANIEKLEDAVNCQVCLLDPREMLFLGCLHLATCFACGGKLTNCPICRAPIAAKLKVFR